MFSLSNVVTGILILFLLAMFFSPEVKGFAIQSLMKIGFFQPNIPQEANDIATKIPEQLVKQEVAFLDLKGNRVRLSDQIGKVVFINFWATWCPPCLAEMPSINTLYSKYKDNKNVVFLLVDVDDTPQKAAAFMKRKKYNLPVYTPATAIPEAYFSGSMPTTIILDKAGNLSFHHVGAANYNNPEVSAFIDKISK